MTPDQYLLSVLTKYQIATGTGSLPYKAGQSLYSVIKEWARDHLNEVLFSGSYAKGTGIKGGTDVDLFISLNSNTPETLKEVYNKLYTYLSTKGYRPRYQNVSIGLNHLGCSVDLVPAKKQSGNTNDHSIYNRRQGSWIQTNVHEHIKFVKDSQRINEIRALKIWRKLNNLNFSSFYLELVVIRALSGKTTSQPANNFLDTMRFLQNELTSARIIDPANSNNIVSDENSFAEKQQIVVAARSSLSKATWEEIIW